MNRRAFLSAVTAGLLAAPLAAEAQQAGKVYRIGFLSSTGCPIRPEVMGPFRQGLLELGYVEGQNISIECRGALGATDRLPGFAVELGLLNVEPAPDGIARLDRSVIRCPSAATVSGRTSTTCRPRGSSRSWLAAQASTPRCGPLSGFVHLAALSPRNPLS